MKKSTDNRKSTTRKGRRQPRNRTLVEALNYIQHGLYILPVHGATDGECNCGGLTGCNPAKHPVGSKVGQGGNDASIAPEMIASWFEHDRSLNLGIHARKSELLILDLDERHGGAERCEALQSELGDLPDTPTVRTPDGFHLYFRHPGAAHTFRSADGIDVIDNGYVVAPPSRNADGRAYSWIIGMAPGELPFADLPAAWIEELGAPGSSLLVTPASTVPAYSEITVGSRNNTLFKKASALRGAGADEQEIQEKLEAINERQCAEPLPVNEIRGIAKSASKHPSNVQKGEIERLGCTDQDNSDRFIALVGDDLRVISESKGTRWLEWNGSRWSETGKHVAMAACREVGAYVQKQKLATDDSNRQTTLGKLDARLGSIGAKNAMITIAASDPRLIVRREDLDQGDMLLTVENGIIDLETGRLHPPEKSLLQTRQIGLKYDQAASAPRFEQFMNEVMGGDKEGVEFLQRALGYSLTGDTSAQCFFILHGKGSNGKSLLLKIMEAILGDFLRVTDFVTLSDLKDKSTGPNPELASLAGSRMVTTYEPSKSVPFSPNRLKQLTGGDSVTTRHLHAEPFTYTPKFKLWIATNPRPRLESGHAMWRRVRLIPFTQTFTGRKCDEKLEQKLLAEKEGILTWLVQGCMKWQADSGGSKGLGTWKRLEDATEDYRLDNDEIGRFLAECFEFGERFHASNTQLKELWKQFSADNAVLLDEKEMLKETKRRFPKLWRSSKNRGIWGLQVKSSE